MKIRSARRASIIAGAVMLALLAFLFRPRPARPLLVVTEMFAEAIEQENLSASAAFLSESFDGEFFATKAEAVSQLQRAFAEVEKLDIDVASVESHLDLTSGTATAMILFHVSGVYVGGQIYNKVPFRSFMAENSRLPEPVYTEWLREAGDVWRLRFVTFEVHDRWDDFPESRALMGK